MLLLLFPHLHTQAQQAQQTYKEKTMPRGTRIPEVAPKKAAPKKKAASKKKAQSKKK